MPSEPKAGKLDRPAVPERTDTTPPYGPAPASVKNGLGRAARRGRSTTGDQRGPDGVRPGVILPEAPAALDLGDGVRPDFLATTGDG